MRPDKREKRKEKAKGKDGRRGRDDIGKKETNIPYRVLV